MFTLDPIGYFHSDATEFYDVPRQPNNLHPNKGAIHLKKGMQFEQALEGLAEFDLLWVIFLFDRHTKWKPKVLPPRGDKKRGVFATRSPHRPNFIGLSCVKLITIEGLQLSITQHDLLDGTPILDLKPYLNYADSLVSLKQGWLEELPPEPSLYFHWSSRAQQQITYLQNNGSSSLKEAIEYSLLRSPFPRKNNRIKQIREGEFELAYQTWRIIYAYEEGLLTLLEIRSGYDLQSLKGEKASKWNDLPLHQAFCQTFLI